MLKYVQCPDWLEPLCKSAEELIVPQFEKRRWNPERGAVLLSGERYIMYRSEAVAVALREQLSQVMGQGAGIVMYQFGKACGRSDAKYYFNKLQVDDSELKHAMGTVACAMNGFAVVEVLPESKPVLNNDYLMVYQHHNSYEAESNLDKGNKSDQAICFMNAGYSAGWCSEASGMNLEAKEITCRATGDSQCRFVLAPPNRIHKRVEEIRKIYPRN